MRIAMVSHINNELSDPMDDKFMEDMLTTTIIE